MNEMNDRIELNKCSMGIWLKWGKMNEMSDLIEGLGLNARVRCKGSMQGLFVRVSFEGRVWDSIVSVSIKWNEMGQNEWNDRIHKPSHLTLASNPHK